MTAPLDRLATDLRAALERPLGDRNRTSHLYNTVMAEEVFPRLAGYHALMSAASRRL